VARVGFNPVTGQEQVSERRRLFTDYELPMKQAYRDFIMNLLEKSENRQSQKQRKQSV